MKKNIYSISVLTAISAIIYYCLKYSVQIGAAVNDSIYRCLNTIIPSMFAFMCISCIITETGLYTIISKPFRYISEKLFKIPSECFSIFLLSLISGYPIGAKLTFDIYDKNIINKKQADMMCCYCFASGPAFIMGTAGNILFPGTKAGLVIFISIAAANLITAILCGFTAQPIKIPKNKSNNNININSGIFINSIWKSASAIVQMCIMIVLFSAFYKIIDLMGITEYISLFISQIFNIDKNASCAAVASFFEISNIINFPAKCIKYLPLITGLLSFGGICVILQISALSHQRINMLKFLCARIFSSFVSGLICWILAPKFINFGELPAITYSLHQENNISPLPSLLLIIMTLMLLANKHRQNNN